MQRFVENKPENENVLLTKGKGECIIVATNKLFTPTISY